MSTPSVVSMEEIHQVLALTDALGIHREAVKIPLAKGVGGVRRLPNGRFEIVIDAQLEFSAALVETEKLLRSLLGSED